MTTTNEEKLDSCNHFIHEPEELFALYDSRLHFPTISLTYDNIMASSTIAQLTNDKEVLNSADENTPTSTKDSSEINESLKALEDFETDLCQNKYCTDADVLNAVCVFSQRTSPVNSADLRKNPTCKSTITYPHIAYYCNGTIIMYFIYFSLILSNFECQLITTCV